MGKKKKVKKLHVYSYYAFICKQPVYIIFSVYSCKKPKYTFDHLVQI